MQGLELQLPEYPIALEVGDLITLLKERLPSPALVHMQLQRLQKECSLGQELDARACEVSTASHALSETSAVKIHVCSLEFFSDIQRADPAVVGCQKVS